MTKTAIRLIGPAFVILTMSSAGALAAEDQSWLCKYLPSACGSEENPGGLPGHGAAGGGASDSGEAATRGISSDSAEPPPAEAPAPAAPAPTPVPPDDTKQP